MHSKGKRCLQLFGADLASEYYLRSSPDRVAVRAIADVLVPALIWLKIQPAA